MPRVTRYSLPPPPALSVGALALGALAVGSIAIGRLAIARLVARSFTIKTLRIESLEVGEWTLPAGDRPVSTDMEPQLRPA